MMIYISFTNWKRKYFERDAWTLKLEKDKASLELRMENLRIQNRGLWDTIDQLKTELRQAKKNDYRDDEGRFKKRPDPIVEESKKPVNWDDIKKAGKR